MYERVGHGVEPRVSLGVSVRGRDGWSICASGAGVE